MNIYIMSDTNIYVYFQSSVLKTLKSVESIFEKLIEGAETLL